MSQTRAVAIIVAAILYLLMPFDALPDFMPLVGWLDDLLVAIVTASYLYNQLKGRGPQPQASNGAASQETPESDPYEILGVARGSDRDAIRKAYRERMAEIRLASIAASQIARQPRVR